MKKNITEEYIHNFFQSHAFLGLAIRENATMVEQEAYTITIELTFKERWIDPVLHPIRLPFEPWVKTRTETRHRTVPSSQILVSERGIMAHPAVVRKLMAQYPGVKRG